MPSRPRPTPPKTTPVATYRLQLHAGFTFDDAAAVVPYLAALGVSHLYLSPILAAVSGSAHGYDTVDPTRIDDERGGEAGFERLWAAARAAGLGLVLDVVPNHLAASPESPWWWDVLLRGESSPHAPVFDVDWRSDDPESDGRVLMPILGRPLDDVLAAGELTLARHGEGLALRYFEHLLPVALPEGADADAVLAESRDPDALRRLLAAQVYRLRFWERADRYLDYRRFFDVSTLVGVRVEDPEVFVLTHEKVLDLVRRGRLDGLRLDHVDGLRDPRGYLRRLATAAEGRWLVVEKILGEGERLRADWPVAGTTGYDFAAAVTGLFVDPAGEAPLGELWREATGETADWATTVAEAKRQVVATIFQAETRRVERLVAAAAAARGHRPPPETAEAIAELVVAFPVYRTYLRPRNGAADADDVAAVDEAVAGAKAARPELAPGIDFLAELLVSGDERPAVVELVERFQQTTGAVMAKGVEDTAFYRDSRLVALAEVGGDPGTFGVSPAELHAFLARRAERWPAGMNVLSTHDTKRSGDVRARIALLSEVPARWADAVRRWRDANAGHRRAPPGGEAPDAATEVLLYQTLVGAHPLPAARAVAYLEKATREAKRRTSWRHPDAAYEEAVRAFTEAVLGDDAFRAELDAFVAPLVRPGRVVALAQALLLATAPGVPDVYQGSELWESSLVDPDNRRPVDFARRRELLAGLGDRPPAIDGSGAAKLWLLRRALGLRRRRPGLFRSAGYRPLRTTGARADHVFAFAREGDGAALVTVVPRLVLGLDAAGGWGDTHVELPAGPLRDVLGGGELAGGATSVADLLATFPVALLASPDAEDAA